jgi:hypothetical protein
VPSVGTIHETHFVAWHIAIASLFMGNAKKKTKAKKINAKKTVKVKAKTTKSLVETTLPSAKLDATHLIDVGGRYNASALTTLATSSLAKMTSAFAAFGFNDPWKEKVVSLVDVINAQVDVVQAGKDDALPGARALDASIAAAKAWRRTAHTVLSVTPGMMSELPAQTGSSIAKLGASLKSVAGSVSAADATPYGGGPKFGAEGKALAKDLDAKWRTHRAEIAKLSPEQKTLHAAKGILYEELKRLARAARSVTPADAHAFAPSMHVRSHRHRADKAPPTPPAPPTPTTTS